jgi:hypothetical protein
MADAKPPLIEISDDEHEDNDEEGISSAQLFHAAAHCAIAQHRVAQHLAETSPGHPRHRGRLHRDIDLNLF